MTLNEDQSNPDTKRVFGQQRNELTSDSPGHLSGFHGKKETFRFQHHSLTQLTYNVDA